MAKIDIERPHRMGTAAARAMVEKVAAAMHEEFGVDSHWQGDVLEFSGSSVNGAITIGADTVRVTAQLGLLLSPFRGRIEQHICSKLDQHLA